MKKILPFVKSKKFIIPTVVLAVVAGVLVVVRKVDNALPEPGDD